MNTGGCTATRTRTHVGNMFQRRERRRRRHEVARPRAGSHDPDTRLDHTRARLDADAVLVIGDAPHTHALAHLAGCGRAQRPQHRVGREHA